MAKRKCKGVEKNCEYTINIHAHITKSTCSIIEVRKMNCPQFWMENYLELQSFVKIKLSAIENFHFPQAPSMM